MNNCNIGPQWNSWGGWWTNVSNGKQRFNELTYGGWEPESELTENGIHEDKHIFMGNHLIAMFLGFPDVQTIKGS